MHESFARLRRPPAALAGLPSGFRITAGAALGAGLLYLLLGSILSGWPHTLLKGSAVSLLALAALQLRVPGAGMLAVVMALGAAGDVLLDVRGLVIAGTAAFAAGHVVAIVFYARHRRQARGADRAIAAGLILFGLVMPPLVTPAALPVGLAMLYAVLLCAMAASLWLSRFPRLTAVGGLAFVASDAVLVLRMGGGRLLGGQADDALVWILYFAGQWLIAVGVARGLLGRAAHPD